MPTLLRIDGYRFFFYSNESNEPAHIHVEKGDAEGKLWLEPSISVEYFVGFNNKEQNYIMQLIKDNALIFIEKWNEYFGKQSI